MVSQRPYRSSNGLKRSTPIILATIYQRRFPSIAPAVPEMMMPVRLISPRTASTPAIGMITSDGLGGNIVSANIRRRLPARSDERRVGQGSVRTGRSRGASYYYTKNKRNKVEQ